MVQLQVINKILETGNSSFITLNNLTDEFFSDYKQEFNFILNHLNKYNEVPDRETFLSVFPDFDIVEVRESFDYLLDALFEDRNKIYLASSFNKVRNLVNEGRVEEAVNYFLSSKEKLSKTAVHLNSVDILKDTSRYERYIEKTEDFNKFYIKTGFKELDEVIGGWDKQEELATIVARPNVGKSFILFKIAAEAAKKGLTVGIYSGEMSEDKVGYRIDTLISGISNTKIIHGNIEVMNDYKKYLDDLKNSIKGSIKVLTPSMIGGPAGVNALKSFIARDKLDILCIDQHSLLEDDRKARNPIDKAANISRDLKNLQVITKIPIIAVSQQNRTTVEEGHDLDVSKIAQTDRIGQDSTIVIFLEQKDNVLTMSLVKSRDSSRGQKLKYYVDFDKGRFEYLPNEKDALNGNESENLRKEYEGEDSEKDDVF